MTQNFQYEPSLVQNYKSIHTVYIQELLSFFNAVCCPHTTKYTHVGKWELFSVLKGIISHALPQMSSLLLFWDTKSHYVPQAVLECTDTTQPGLKLNIRLLQSGVTGMRYHAQLEHQF